MISPADAATVWIDTDPSIGLPFREVDDGFALLLAFRSPEIRIVGISATYGNASLKQTTRIAQDLSARFGRNADQNAVPVFPGASSREDLGRATAATDALAKALKQERLTYLALGPLTNLATLVQLHPELSERIDRIIIVGGQTTNERPRLGRGGWLRIHDANVFKDSSAAAKVLQTNCPISLAPIATSLNLIVTADDLRKMRSNSAGKFLYSQSRTWSWFWRRIIGQKGGPLFDALAILAVVRPKMLVAEKRFASVDEKGNLIAAIASHNGNRFVTYYSGLNAGAISFVRDRLTQE